MKMATFVLILATVLSGLIAGLFYAYSCSVNIGLGRLPDKDYLLAMQSINRAILNPLFFVSFIGTLVLLPLSAILHYQQPFTSRFIWLVLASVTYIAGSFAVTIFGNVPLNEMLDKAPVSDADSIDLSMLRKRFEISWNRLHTIRTLASIAAFVLVVIACLKQTTRS